MTRPVRVRLTDETGNSLKKRHTGKYLALQFTNTVKAYKIEKKVLGFTGDNAANNNTMIDALEKKLPDSPCGPSTQGHCLLHIFNLVDKAACQLFTAKAKVKKVESEEDDEEEDGAGTDDEENGEGQGDSDDENSPEDNDDRLLHDKEVDPGCDKQNEEVLEEAAAELEDILKE
ncbi:hypothetical protein V5O48_014394 [Marasmius crinis-equi]|uniref:Uncharacterized protein n=1 Tax=Marasmius crinis-equi TaxID=585013 RepID=A0ABR3EXE9_9AGAR